MKTALFVALMFVAQVMLSQTAQGPAAGSVASGAVTSTDSFQPEGPLSYPGPIEQESEPQKVPIRIIPTPADAPPPTGPQGSNYIEWHRDRLSKVTGVPITLGSFEGLRQTIYIPPDPYIAAGPDDLILVVNNSFRICDKSGTTLKTISAASWFGNVLSNPDIYDPKVCYDHFHGRWIIVWLHQSGTIEYILLSVSDDSDPIGTWYNWALPANLNGTTDANNWSDYEGVGYDQNAIYITSNQWSLPFPGTFMYSKVRIIGTQQLYANTAGSVTWNDLWDIRDAIGNQVPGIRPSKISGTPSAYYLVGWPSFSTNTYVALFRITDPLGTPAITAVDIPVVAFTIAPNADQLGGSTTKIDGGGSVLRNEPTYRDSSLWLVHSVASGPGGQYSSASMLRLNTVTNTAAEDFTFGLAGYWFFYPALAVDKDKNVVITFTISGTDQYAGAYYSWRTASDPPGLQSVETMHEGGGNYVVTAGTSRNRWGDYNGAAIDPSDENNFWMMTEYASGTNTFSTWVRGARVVPYSGPHLTTSSQSLDFGMFEKGASSDTNGVTLQNLGSSVLTISGIGRSNSDFTVFGFPTLPFQLNTFETIALNLTFSPSVHGTVADTLVITSDDAVSPGRITLTGKGLIIGRAQPGVFYATSGPTGGSTFTIDGATGAPTVIGSLALSEIQGLAIHPVTKQLYGTLATSAGTSLYRVSADFGDVLPDRVIPIPNMRAIAFGGGDTLYGGTTSGRVYRISMTTGDTSTVGATSPVIVFSALAFNPVTRTLWASVRPPLVGRDKIYTVDTQTGMATEIGATGFAAATTGIAFDPLGNLYGVTGVGSQTNSLIRIDQTTGAGTLIGSTGISGLNALAMRDDSLSATGVEHPGTGIPETFVLLQNYPNPFNPSTSITFGLPAASSVQLSIYNMIGQRVVTLIDHDQSPGFHTAVWNGRDFNGETVASGVYIYRIEASTLSSPERTFTDAKKLLLLK